MLTKHLLAMLATWRITEILIDEDAPFDLASRLRAYALKQTYQVHRDDYSNWQPSPRGIWYELHRALECRWCMSVQIGIFIAIITGSNPLWGFAYSAGSLLFGKLFNAIPTYIHGEVESQVFNNGTQ